MRLADYLRPMDRAQRERLAAACSTTYPHLRNVAFSGKACGEKLAVALEQHTSNAVRRWDTRPLDWWLIWPELIGMADAPAVPVQKAA